MLLACRGPTTARVQVLKCGTGMDKRNEVVSVQPPAESQTKGWLQTA